MIAKEELRQILASVKPEAARALAVFVAKELDALATQVWAFGLAEGNRRAVAIVAQMAGELGIGAVRLFDEERWYAGAALVRQLIETEYLLCLFGQNDEEPMTWLKASDDEMRTMFSPGQMRKRAQGQFDANEYSVHCKSGGHPRPWGARLLREHLLLVPLEEQAVLDPRNQWVDLAQHVERVWCHYVLAIKAHSPSNFYPERFASVFLEIEEWHKADPAAFRLRNAKFPNDTPIPSGTKPD